MASIEVSKLTKESRYYQKIVLNWSGVEELPTKLSEERLIAE